jgi:glycosyltransferase involved in cell wall biosynthesis
MERKASVSLCMIVKNEEKYIEKCLLSVKDIVNEMIIVDTGSTDNTISIAQNFSVKIVNYAWNDSFSEARNFSISKANCDWILLLDADEEFEKKDTDKFIEFINGSNADGCHFTVCNYLGKAVNNNYTVHNAFRLLRNNKKYQFDGDIHEQIRRIDGKKIENGTFDVQNIKLHHYGYLDDVIKEKNKRERNIPILLKKLEQEPEDSFTLFNLGNEYLAESNYPKALDLYNKAYDFIDKTQAYAPHLIYRRAMSFYNIRQFEYAVKAVAEGLNIYPQCTDLEYLRGTVYFDWGKYTLAIDSFNKCIQMGEPPSSLKFMDFCATTRPLISLGELYHKLGDYDKALDSYTRAFNIDNSIYRNLYIIGEILNKKYEDKAMAVAKLSEYFSSLEYVPNLVALTDILMWQRLYDLAQETIDKMNKFDGNETDKIFLQAKSHFYHKEYEKAFELFESIVISQDKTNVILPNISEESTQFLFVIAMISVPQKLADTLLYVKTNCDEITSKVYSQCLNIFNGDEQIILTENDDCNLILTLTSALLDKVLRVKEFIIFEKLLYIYNVINSKSVLINLAEIYYQNNYYKLAAGQVLKSVKELDFINLSGIEILSKTRYML